MSSGLMEASIVSETLYCKVVVQKVDKVAQTEDATDNLQLCLLFAVYTAIPTNPFRHEALFLDQTRKQEHVDCKYEADHEYTRPCEPLA